MIEAVNRFQWLTLLYAALILLYPETSEASYITISGNLLIPALFGLLAKGVGTRGLLTRGIGITGVAVILIYGGRTSLLSVGLAVGLLLFVWGKRKRTAGRAVFLLAVIAALALVLLFYEDILQYLLMKNPSSRTLRLLAEGEFLWTSNREDYYAAALDSIFHHPLRVYGFLGDRFYYADTFSVIGDNALAATMFSHNSALEILLNFGVPLGLAILLYLLNKTVKAMKSLSARNDMAAWLCHLIIFASSFVAAFVSSSWLNDYTVWLTCGSIFALASKSYIPQKNLWGGI